MPPKERVISPNVLELDSTKMSTLQMMIEEVSMGADKYNVV